MTEWTQVPLQLHRSWWSVVWNPRKREKKALFDAVTSLAAGSDQAALVVSIPYLTLLNTVSAIPRTHPATTVQFLVVMVENQTPHNAEFVYVSQNHSL